MNIPLEEYKKALANHDWFYSFSDDHSVWSRGERERSRLISIAEGNGNDFKQAYNDEVKRNFFNEGFYKHGEEFRPPFKLS